MVLFENALRAWYDFGLLDVIIPFILVFTVVYAVLQRTRILGSTRDEKPKNNINAMFAFVVGFIVIATLQIVNAITIMAQYFVLATIAITLVIIIAALLGIKDWEKTKFPLVLGCVITLIIAIYALGFQKKINIGFFDARIVPIILGLLFILGIIYYITRTPKKEKKKPAKTEKKKEEPKKAKKEPGEAELDKELKKLSSTQKDEIIKDIIAKQRAIQAGIQKQQKK